MTYQVMLQTPQGWALFRRPTHNARDAQLLAQLAAATFPGMQSRVLAAVTDGELEHLCTQWQHDHSHREMGTLVATVPRTTEQWHARMNTLELGPGGDHDVPYTYQTPPHRDLAFAWLHLAASVARGELGGAQDGDRVAR